MDEVKGLTVIFTGNGKGKTSAALGCVMRALGHGMNVKVIQFIKANANTGELTLLAKFAPQAEVVQTGKGFTWRKEYSEQQHRDAAQEGMKMAEAAIAADRYGLILLDEILYALGKGLVSIEQIFALIDAKPSRTHLILTGRGAPQALIDRADMVSSIEPVKHPMEKGITAQKGLDY